MNYKTASAGRNDGEVVNLAGSSYGSFSYRTYVLGSLTVVYTFNFIDRILISVVGVPIINVEPSAGARPRRPRKAMKTANPTSHGEAIR